MYADADEVAVKRSSANGSSAPQVQVELEHVAKAVATLRENAAELCRRLEPVTGDVPFADEPKEVEDRDLVPIAGDLWLLRRQVEDANGQLSRAIDRLQI